MECEVPRRTLACRRGRSLSIFFVPVFKNQTFLQRLGSPGKGPQRMRHNPKIRHCKSFRVAAMLGCKAQERPSAPPNTPQPQFPVAMVNLAPGNGRTSRTQGRATNPGGGGPPGGHTKGRWIEKLMQRKHPIHPDSLNRRVCR